MDKAKKKILITRILRVCILAAAAVALFLLGKIPEVAEYFFARGLTCGAGRIIGFLTGLLPVSFYEWTAVFLIVGGVALFVWLIVTLCRRRFARVGRAVYRLGVAVLCVLIAYGALYAPLYQRASAVSALGLTETEVTEEEVYAAAEYYVEALNRTAEALERDEEGNVVSPHSFSETADLINAEFEKIDADGYFAPYDVRPKRVVLSVPMSYLGITGIYFPFYAEANVNVNIPSYEIPNTMAHEMAHAKGVSRENEANIVSYVLCIRSEDAYLRYSGLMRAASVMLGNLDGEESAQLRARLAPEILREYANGSAHYAKYEGPIDRISAFFNDLFLKANGVGSGTRSYGETARSLVALHKTLEAE